MYGESVNDLDEESNHNTIRDRRKTIPQGMRKESGVIVTLLQLSFKIRESF
jgi:hypothetical protein